MWCAPDVPRLHGIANAGLHHDVALTDARITSGDVLPVPVGGQLWQADEHVQPEVLLEHVLNLNRSGSLRAGY
jgi:hypothetical protein